jgi:protein-L-isoaspartate(D-aspartate) O-methyltransferase
MVAYDIAGRGVRDEAVLAAMRTVPRDRFVPEPQRSQAHADHPLPIGHGQTISQPFIVAAMAEAARLGPDDRVLEIGTGSGYGAAVLREVADHVVTVERIPELATEAAAALEATGYDDVVVVTGDGTDGWAEGAPYDAIVVTAAGPEPPTPLVDQLAEGGRLVMPVGRRHGHQVLARYTRRGDGLDREDLGDVRFVPLIGTHGFRR